MKQKDGYNAFQTHGANHFKNAGEDVAIIYPGTIVNDIKAGQVVLFWRAVDRLVWYGRAYPDCYEFIVDQPISPIEALAQMRVEAWKKREGGNRLCSRMNCRFDYKKGRNHFGLLDDNNLFSFPFFSRLHAFQRLVQLFVLTK